MICGAPHERASLRASEQSSTVFGSLVHFRNIGRGARSDGAPVSACAPLDERLVAELCRAAERQHGDADDVVRAHLRRVAPLGERRHRRAAGARRRRPPRRPRRARRDCSPTTTVDEVLVNAHGDIWVERDGRLHRAGDIAAVDLAVVVERILAPLGRRLDRSSPVVDARLPDGSRVCAVVPPVATDGACLSVRRFRDRSRPLDSFGSDDRHRPHRPARRRRGATWSSAAPRRLARRRCSTPRSGACRPGERIVTIEDTAELLPATVHLLRLEARPATVDGPPAITLEQLVRTALRLRPDRLVVGEVRGPEVLALVQALNTGHDGSWSTCHANSALDVLHRLETLVVQAAPAWPLPAVAPATHPLDRRHRPVGPLRRRRIGGWSRSARSSSSGDRLALRPLLDDGVGRRRPDSERGGDVDDGCRLAAVLCVVLVAARMRPSMARPRRRGRTPRWHRRRRARRAGLATEPGRAERRRRRSVVPARGPVVAGRQLVDAGHRRGRSRDTARGRRPFPEIGHAVDSRACAASTRSATTPAIPRRRSASSAPVLRACAELGGPPAAPLERVADVLLARATERDERIAGDRPGPALGAGADGAPVRRGAVPRRVRAGDPRCARHAGRARPASSAASCSTRSAGGGWRH